jgi:hypothetical protein
MAAPQIGALPAISSPTAGQASPFANAGMGLAGIPDAARADELKKMLFQQQMIQASQAAQNQISQQITQDPSQQTDQQQMRIVQQLYDKLGLKAPIGQINTGPGQQTGAQGDAGVVPADVYKRGILTGALGSGGGNYQQWVDKNQAELLGLTPEQRLQAVHMAGFNPQGAQLQALSGPVVESEANQLKRQTEIDRRDKAANQNFQSGVTSALKSANPAALHAVVESAIGTARANGWSDERINDVYEPFLQDNIAKLSPLQTAQMRHYEGLTDEMKQLLQPRIAALDAATSERQANISKLKQTTANLATIGQLLPQTLRSTINMNTSKATANEAASDRDYESADWYAQRTSDDINGGSPAEKIAAQTALQKAYDDKMTTITRLQTAITSYRGSMGALGGDASSKAKAEADIKKMEDRVTALQTDANKYQQTYTSILSSGTPAAPSGAGLPAPGGGKPPGALVPSGWKTGTLPDGRKVMSPDGKTNWQVVPQ